jgi:hypothetical protein
LPGQSSELIPLNGDHLAYPVNIYIFEISFISKAEGYPANTYHTSSQRKGASILSAAISSFTNESAFKRTAPSSSVSEERTIEDDQTL